MIINHDFNPIPPTRRNDLAAQASAGPNASNLGLTLFVGLDDHVQLSRTNDESQRALTITAGQMMKMSACTFDALAPRLILTPLVVNGIDAMDFARLLAEFGFQGRYRAVVFKLPDASFIIREIKAAAPDINFGIMELAGMKTFEKRAG